MIVGRVVGGSFSFSRSVCMSVYSAGMRYGANKVFRERMVTNFKMNNPLVHCQRALLHSTCHSSPGSETTGR